MRGKNNAGVVFILNVIGNIAKSASNVQWDAETVDSSLD